MSCYNLMWSWYFNKISLYAQLDGWCGIIVVFTSILLNHVGDARLILWLAIISPQKAEVAADDRHSFVVCVVGSILRIFSLAVRGTHAVILPFEVETDARPAYGLEDLHELLMIELTVRFSHNWRLLIQPLSTLFEKILGVFLLNGLRQLTPFNQP